MTENEVVALPSDVLNDHAFRMGLVSAPWDRPTASLAEAEAVFRGLRARGWMLSNSWVPQRPPGLQGYLEAIKGVSHFGVHYAPETEARMLVACAVLAAEHDAEQEE